MTQSAPIKGDGIGVDVAEAAMAIVDKAIAKHGAPAVVVEEIYAGAKYFKETGQDIQTGGEEAAGKADAIYLGAIGLPSVRHENGTEIGPHLRLRDRFGLYAGVRPVKAYPNAPQRLADPRAAGIDMIILRESTEGLFYSAVANGGGEVIGDDLARRRKERGKPGKLTCVDEAAFTKHLDSTHFKEFDRETVAFVKDKRVATLTLVGPTLPAA